MAKMASTGWLALCLLPPVQIENLFTHHQVDFVVTIQFVFSKSKTMEN